MFWVVVWRLPGMTLTLTSVCPSVTICKRCALWLSESVYTAKSCTSQASSYLSLHHRHFCCRMYCLSTKRTEKTSGRNANLSFWDRQSGAHWSCYVPLFTDFDRDSWTLGHAWVDWIWVPGCVHKLYPLNRIVRISRSSTCNRNRFDSLPVYRTSWAVRSAITATADSLLFSAGQIVALVGIRPGRHSGSEQSWFPSVWIHARWNIGNQTFRTIDVSYHLWTFRTMDDSYHGLFAPSLDFSYRSYHGRFVPS